MDVMTNTPLDVRTNLVSEPAVAAPRTRYGRSRRPVLATFGRVLLTMVAMFAVVLTGSLAGSGVLQALGAPELAAAAGAHLLVFLLAIVVAWLLMRRLLEGDRSGYLALGWNNGRALTATLIGLGAAAASIGAGMLLLIARGDAEFRLLDTSVIPDLAWTLVVMFTVSVLLQGFPEELLWRGYLQTTLMERLGHWVAVMIGAVGFGVLHVVSMGSGTTVIDKALYVLMAIGLGAACGALRLVTGSTWAAIGFHSGFHLALRGSEFIVGGGEGGMPIGEMAVVLAVVTGICFVVWRVRDLTPDVHRVGWHSVGSPS